MAVDLRPIFARLERARAHTDALTELLEEYEDRPPFRVRPRTGSRDDSIVERAELIDAPPIAAAMLVSDAVHQARAALDNLVNALRTGGLADGIAFPVATDETVWRTIARKRLEGVPAATVEAIARVQPFSNDPLRWAGDELVALHDLARFDRHRVPPLHAAVVTPAYAFGDGGETGVAFRRDREGRWAEAEYVVGTISKVVFKVEVSFGADAGEESVGLDVNEWTRRLVDVAVHVVDVVLRAPAR